jgi:hypothetical protein
MKTFITIDITDVEVWLQVGRQPRIDITELLSSDQQDSLEKEIIESGKSEREDRGL